MDRDTTEKKPFEPPTLTEYGRLAEITTGNGWAWGHTKIHHDDRDDLRRLPFYSVGGS